MYLKYQTLTNVNKSPISGVYGIIYDNTNGIISNNYSIDGTGFCNIITNSNIVIENNNYNQSLQKCIYSINSLYNNNINVDTNKIKNINDFVKYNISFVTNNENSLVNIFTGIAVSYSIFDASINNGFITDLNNIWSAKFSNDGGCALGYHWSDIGICINSGKINLSEFPDAFSIMNNEQFIYPNGKQLTLVLTKTLNTPIILNNFKNGKFVVDIEPVLNKSSRFNVINNVISIDVLNAKNYTTPYYLFNPNKIDTLFLGLSGYTYQFQLTNLNTIEFLNSFNVNDQYIKNTIIFNANNVNKFVTYEQDISVKTNNTNVAFQVQDLDINFQEYFYLGEADSNLIKYSNSKTIYNIGVQFEQSLTVAKYKLTYISGAFYYKQFKQIEGSQELQQSIIYNDSAYILNKLKSYAFNKNYKYIDLPGLVSGGFDTLQSANAYANRNSTTSILIDAQSLGVILNTDLDISGTIKYKLQKYISNKQTIINSNTVSNTNFIYTTSDGNYLKTTAHYPLILTGSIVQYNNKQISGTFDESFNTALVSGKIQTNDEYDHSLYEFNKNNRHTYKLSIPTFYSKNSDLLQGILFNHTHKNLLINTDDSGLIKYTDYPQNPESIGANTIDAHYLSTRVKGINIPILQSLPIGCIVPIFQIYAGNTWYPQIPYGFYELTDTQQEIPIIATDVGSKHFNLPLAYLLKRADHTLNLSQAYSFKLPAIAPLLQRTSNSDRVSKVRIAYMIKYNFNVFEKD